MEAVDSILLPTQVIWSGFKKSKSKSRYLREVKEWGRNQAKWEAAEQVCNKHGWKFIILTEDHINPHKYLNYGR